MRPDPRSPALVTGAASGIGRAVAVRFAQAGRPVYALDVDHAGLRSLEPLGVDVFTADVCDAGARERAVAEIEHRHGHVGALVNNVGCGVYGPVESLDLDSLRHLWESNVLAGLGLVQRVLPGMRDAGRGRIVAMGSVVAHASVPMLAGYAATKAATASVYDALRMEVAQFGIDVVQIEPGAVRTGFAEHTEGLWDPRTGRPPSPYHGLTVWQRRAIVAVLRAPVSACRPETVADAVVRSVDATRPPARVRPAQARIDLAARALAPRPVWDRTMRLFTRL